VKPLKIAVYYPWVYLKGGIERSLAALISRSRHDWTIFTSHYEPANTFAEFAKFKVVQVADVSVRRDMGAVFKVALNIIGTRLPLAEFDAYVVWCDGLGTLTTFRNAHIPTFCICSTPLRAAYDPVYAQQALHNRQPLAKLAYHLFKRSFRFVDRLAWSRFDGVVATSLEVKARIVRNRLYPDNPRMVLYHPGIDVGDAPKKVSYEPFLLVPGRISWTKNIELAVDAFVHADLPPPWRLVVAGFVDQKSQRYLEELKQRAGDHGRIEFVVSPSDERLNRLYETAYAVLFTPLNEDWGMAVLEAMLRSKPVIANASGGPKESVIDGGTGWLLEPEVGQWSALLRSLPDQADAVKNMGAQARLHVEKYDWKKFVNGIDDMIDSTVRNKTRALPAKSKPNALTS
jgi:glycosyltransferase involved in cell wall biosynthesis